MTTRGGTIDRWVCITWGRHSTWCGVVHRSWKTAAEHSVWLSAKFVEEWAPLENDYRVTR